MKNPKKEIKAPLKKILNYWFKIYFWKFITVNIHTAKIKDKNIVWLYLWSVIKKDDLEL